MRAVDSGPVDQDALFVEYERVHLVVCMVQVDGRLPVILLLVSGGVVGPVCVVRQSMKDRHTDRDQVRSQCQRRDQHTSCSVSAVNGVHYTRRYKGA